MGRSEMWVLCGLLQTALHWASDRGHVEAIRALKEVGFTAFDVQDNAGQVSMIASDMICV